jgi:hypothetical protein
MFVMGLFGFIGKAVKGVAKGIGKVAKIGVGVAKFGLTSGLLPIPGGGLVGKVAGTLLQAKRPMSTTAQKFPIPISVLRGKTPSTAMRRAGQILLASTPRMQQASPVLPGGAIATRSGPVAASGAPPLNFSGSTPAKRKRKKRSSSRKRSSAKRSGRKRRLKFGSPAWRKKYLGHGRRKRRKRAA